MICTCPKCGNDFLTEADPYITVPSSKGYTLYCTCELSRLKAENELMREGLEFYACRFSWDSDKYDGAYLIKELDRGNITYTETDGDIFTDVSGGKKAREILSKINESKDETKRVGIKQLGIYGP